MKIAVVALETKNEKFIIQSPRVVLIGKKEEFGSHPNSPWLKDTVLIDAPSGHIEVNAEDVISLAVSMDFEETSKDLNNEMFLSGSRKPILSLDKVLKVKKGKKNGKI